MKGLNIWRCKNMANKIVLDTKVAVEENVQSKNLWFVNGFLIEKNQKVKFSFKTENPKSVELFQNLNQNRNYHVNGELIIKYKKHIYPLVIIHNIRDAMTGEMILEDDEPLRQDVQALVVV